MILLLELHRYGQTQTDEIKQKLTFYPCGQPKGDGKLEYPTLLFRLIGYSNCIGYSGFTKTVGSFLSKANLSKANLIDAYLSNAYLSNAYLIDAELESTYLIEVKNLTSSQIKSARNWEKAFYKGEFDAEKYKWIVNQEANQQYIKELEQDTSSDTL
ncbi:MAG: pentapeptide repeat-containing protein [Xenococcaceae cyanobacterium MO_207.B15]|nr:pentapeptide repeat-containing protein [Xenococcaceae cyanobacterium MO_207.B15]